MTAEQMSDRVRDEWEVELEDVGVVIDTQLSLREGLKRSGADFVVSYQQFISGKGCALRDCGKHHSLTAIVREQLSQRETTT